MISGRHALVTDFGVAKAVSEATGRQQLTTAGVALGTPSYMAPEQAAADPNLDHRVDIYAVGAMAYELLSGRPPFTGMTPQQILAAHVTQTPDPLSRHRPTCPPALEAVIMRCLAKRAADRWQTAEELLNNLEPLATPSGGMTPTQTRPITGWQAETKARRWMPALIGVGMLAIIGLGWAAFRGRGAPPPAALERVQLTFTGNAANPGISDDGTRIAYTTRQCDSAGVCTLDVVIQDVGGAGSATVLRGVLAVWDIQWTADGRYLVLGASTGTGWGAYSVPTLGGEPRYLGCCDASIVGASDTALVAYPAAVGDSVGWIRWVTIADGVARDSLAVHQGGGIDNAGGGLRAESFPDSRRLLIQTSRNRVDVARITTRAGETLDSMVFDGPQLPFDVDVAADGRSLIVTMRRPYSPDQLDMLRYRVSGNGRIAIHPDTIVRQLSISDGGDVNRHGVLVYGFGPTEYSVWALRRDKSTSMQFAQRRLTASTGLITGSLSPDGGQVLLGRPAATGDSRRQFSVMPFDSGPETSLGPPTDWFDWDWSQDGRSLMVASPRGTDSVAIGRVDVPSGRLGALGVVPRSQFIGLETVRGGGAIIRATARSFRRFGLPGLPDSTFLLPDTVGTLVWLDPAPDGGSFVSVGWDQEGNYVLVHRISIVDGTATRLATLGGEGHQPPKWLDDGSIIVPILETEWNLAWYRIPPGGGDPVRMGSPPRYPGLYRWSGDGLRVMARTEERRSDIYLIPNYGEAMKQ
jgi:hypothetical protein